MMNVLEVLLTALIPLLAIFLLYIKLKRMIPNLIQDVLNDVGQQLNEIFKEPTVSRAMGILGSKSGESRALKGAQNKLAEGILDQIPEAKIVLDRIAPNLIEDYGADTVLQLISRYAPMLKGFLPQGVNTGSHGDSFNRSRPLKNNRYW